MESQQQKCSHLAQGQVWKDVKGEQDTEFSDTFQSNLPI